MVFYLRDQSSDTHNLQDERRLDCATSCISFTSHLVSGCAEAWASFCSLRIIRCWKNVIVLPSTSVVAVKNYQLYSVIAHITAHCLHSVRVHSTLPYHLVHLPYWCDYKWIHTLPHVPMVLLRSLFIKHMAVKCIHIAVPYSIYSLSAAVHWWISLFPLTAVAKVTYQTTAEKSNGDVLAKVNFPLQMTSQSMDLLLQVDLPLVDLHLMDINWRFLCQSTFN